jgi:hypothetical protein
LTCCCNSFGRTAKNSGVARVRPSTEDQVQFQTFYLSALVANPGPSADLLIPDCVHSLRHFHSMPAFFQQLGEGVGCLFAFLGRRCRWVLGWRWVCPQCSEASSLVVSSRITTKGEKRTRGPAQMIRFPSGLVINPIQAAAVTIGTSSTCPFSCRAA